MDYFSSDWHIGHEAVIRLGSRPFANIQEMNQYIEHMALSGKKKGDAIYFLGDLGNDKQAIGALLENIKKHKIAFHWILGNHDGKLPLTTYLPLCTSIQQARTIKREHVVMYLHHTPCLTWDGSFRNSYHLYGHVHEGSAELVGVQERMGGKSLNVNIEFNGYEMWILPEVFAYMESRPSNWDVIERFL